MENTKIEWADHTVNFWSTHVTVPGKRLVSADTLVRKLEREACKRIDSLRPGMSRVDHPLSRPRVFVNSLSDWLDPEVPVEWLADLLAAIHAAPHLNFLLLTKRPELWRERIGEALVALDYNDRFDKRRYIARWALAWVNGTAPRNIWVGATVEDQQRGDERIPHLIKIPARVRFLSCEPLLGPVDLTKVPRLDNAYFQWRGETGVIGPKSEPDDYVYWSKRDLIHWVIVGGESGPNARPMHPDWARSLRDQCQAAGVPYFFKQWGEWAPWQTKPNVPRWMGSDREFEDCGGVVRNFDKAAFRLLDGVEWSQLPEVLP